MLGDDEKQATEIRTKGVVGQIGITIPITAIHKKTYPSPIPMIDFMCTFLMFNVVS